MNEQETLDYARIAQAIGYISLSEPLLKCKLVFLNGFYGLLRVY